ncbi:molybdopterin-dependent oxidoreductase [Coralliovum pocilloporae]|uniref:molybdopterin-dependent oxidoreductase n=1 Tax=Coralliovum pocilloporae TaxID=3066369 RepID=UPI0033073151
MSLAPATLAHAQDIILTISGKTADGTEKHYTLKDLETFQRHEVKTHTPWHSGLVHFEGVLLKDLLDDTGITSGDIRVIALNDYSALIPVSDAAAFGPVLAYKLNGTYMRIEDKGPLFMIYPFDDNPDLQVEAYHSRSVWQTRSIEAK